MKKYLSYTMGLVGAALALCSSISAQAVRIQAADETNSVTFKFWNGLSNSDRTVDVFRATPGRACYETYYQDYGWQQVAIRTGKIASYNYTSPPGSPTIGRWTISGDSVICFRVVEPNGNNERFSDILLVKSLKNQEGEIHMVYRYKTKFGATTIDENGSASAGKTIEESFHFEGAQGTKYVNVSYDVSESWEGDSISFFQPHLQSDNRDNILCNEVVKDKITNRENQFIAFNFKSDEDKKIEKIYNLPVYTFAEKLSDLTADHYLCFFKWGSGFWYNHVYASDVSSDFHYPAAFSVNPISHQCLGTIHLIKAASTVGYYRAYWDTQTARSGDCQRE